MKARLAFWFEFASSYSYPAAARVDAVAAAHGVSVDYRPFLLGPIFADQGWNDSPFNLYPAKGRYMWRDLERICEEASLPFARPSVFPRNGLLAARVARAFQDEPWLRDFVRSVYHAGFAEDRDIGSEEVVAQLLAALGCDAAAALARARSAETKDALRAQTARAVELGIFGAPSFVAAGELFWGNDRLEAACRWASGRGAAAREGAVG